MKLRFLVAAFITLAAFTSPAKAQEEYPCQGTVRMVLPFGAGSTTDVNIRHLAAKLAPLIGRNIVIENIVGADGALGARHVLSSAPDGCTILVGTNGTIGIEPRLGPQGFDLEKATPVGMFARNFQVLVVNPAIAGNMREFVAYAKQHPGTTFGRAATSGLIACSYFAKKAGLQMTGVPYTGGDAKMLPDLLSGRVASGCPFLSPVRTQIEAGGLRALAVLGSERFKDTDMRDVPAITEALPGSEDLAALEGHAYLMCPLGCPQAAVRMLSRHLKTVLAENDTIAVLRKNGSDATYSTPEALAEYIRAQTTLFKKVVRELGLEFKPAK